MTGRKNHKLFLLSLQVLTRYNEGARPSQSDVSTLRLHAGPDAAALPVDELCCTLIRRELGTLAAANAAHTIEPTFAG